VIEREHNVLLDEKLAEEWRHLRPLPPMALPAYTTMTAKVRRWSTIRVVNRSCSVPARLIDERVRVLLHHDHLEVYFAGKLVERLPRIRGQRPARVGKGSRTLTRAGGFIRFSATPMRLTAYAIESIVKTDGGMVEVEGTEEFEA
jgi:hypothetical protein